MENFYSFCVFLHKFFAVLRSFLRNPMSCWRFYYAVGVPAVASTVVGISTISGISFVAGLPSAVDVWMLLML
jgi:hypothetical protein